MTASTARDRSAEAPGAPSLSLAEHVCLALVVEGLSHGWAIGTVLSPGGELGRIWSLTRPLTYRAIDQLQAKGLIARSGVAAGRSRDRVVLTATAEGRAVSGNWLDEPVQHLRDVRTELLLKLTLRSRAGRDSEGLLAAQLAVFEDRIDALTARADGGDLVDLWRRESARAVRRFLEQALRPATPGQPRPELRISARNQLRATVTVVHHGDVMSTIHATLTDGQRLTAAITRDAADELDLAPGDDVVLLVKSTEVMVAKPS